MNVTAWAQGLGLAVLGGTALQVLGSLLQGMRRQSFASRIRALELEDLRAEVEDLGFVPLENALHRAFQAGTGVRDGLRLGSGTASGKVAVLRRGLPPGELHASAPRR